MGACYEVTLKAKVKDEKGAILALNEHIKNDKQHYQRNGQNAIYNGKVFTKFIFLFLFLSFSLRSHILLFPLVTYNPKLFFCTIKSLLQGFLSAVII